MDSDMEEELARVQFEQLPPIGVLLHRRLDALSYAWANLSIEMFAMPNAGIEPESVRKLFEKACNEYLTRLHYGQRSKH